MDRTYPHDPYYHAVRFDVGDWCRRNLGGDVAETLLQAGNLSAVCAVRLDDGREVVVKSRPDSPRLRACTKAQQALWRSGFPAPQPLCGPIVEDGLAISAEAYIPGGSTPTTAPPFAQLLARFVALAPTPGSVGALAPDPPWVAWDHDRHGVWPEPDDRVADLNALDPETLWLDEVGDRVRRRLARFVRHEAADPGDRPRLGHGDWEARNLRWRGDEPLVVHDWDSVIAAPEPLIAGFAAAVWPCGIELRAASIEESADFIDAYQRASGRVFSRKQEQASWAAGLWVYAFNAKKASLDGEVWLDEREADERLRLAGA